MATKPIPAQDLLLQLLSYDPETGKLFWKERPISLFASIGAFRSWNTKFAGAEAFTATGCKGYRSGRIFNSHYLAQRVIWKMVTGRDPVEVDHGDGNRQNNRLTNLSDVSSAGNGRNSGLRSDNTSGFTGVYWHAGSQKWRAKVKVDGRDIQLGEYGGLQDAVEARKAADIKYGFSDRHGT